jgi:IS30 family transposase
MPQPLAHFVQAHAAHPQEGMRAAYAMRAIAEAFGVHEATVSRAVKRRERAVESA